MHIFNKTHFVKVLTDTTMCVYIYIYLIVKIKVWLRLNKLGWSYGYPQTDIKKREI